MSNKTQFNNFDKKQKLCNLCIHARVKKKKGLVCNLTNNVADFHSYCPSFKVHPARDDKINSGKINVNTSFIFFGFVAFYIFVILLITKSHFSIIIAFLLFLLLSYSISTKKTSKIVIILGRFPYTYFIAINYALKQKPLFGDAEISILTQQIIKLFGRRGISYANEIFRLQEDLWYKTDNYVKKMSVDEKKIIFSAVCQMYVFHNISDFKTSKVLQKIASKLNLQKGYYDQIKAKYLKKELIYLQELKYQKEHEAKQKNQQKNEQGHKIYNFANSKFYKILGVSQKASINSIKKRFKALALKHHPDRFIGKSEIEQNMAEEKFKEITEAYNYIRRKRGF